MTPNDCPPAANECVLRTCTVGMCGTAFVAQGTPTVMQVPGDCQQTVCNGAGGLTPQTDNVDVPVDNNACTDDVCKNGAPFNPASPIGTPCAQMGGAVCDGAGACVGCNVAADCASNVCSMHVCQVASCNDGVKNGGETGVDCGGPCGICPTVLLLASDSSGVTGASFSPGSPWQVTPLGGAAGDDAAVAIDKTGKGIGLVHADTTNLLRYATWGASAWSALADVGPMITTRSGPAVITIGGTATALFQGTDFKYYTAQYAGAWAAVTTVGLAAAQSFGPVTATIAPVGSDVSVGFIDGNNSNHATSRDRVAGAWSASVDVGSPTNFNIAPTIIALTSGPELMIAYVSGSQVMFATRKAGVWSAPAAIMNVLTNDRVALAPLPNGDAILAIRGTDGKLYFDLYANGAWGAVGPFSNPNVSIAAPPVVAKGQGVVAEIAFIDAGGVEHSRLTGTWSLPVNVAGKARSVALASAP